MISVNLTVQTGETLCLFGPSATGKSSILSVIAGFEKGYKHAYLSIDEKVLMDTNVWPKVMVPPWNRKIGYMEQSARLFPHLNVEQNILYGVSGNIDKEWVDRIIESVDLKDALLLKPNQISGGMSQRVALARALAAKPHVLLLDEPFSALDRESRRTLQELVRDVKREFSITMILVTHQLTEAQRMADQIALIDQGMILQTGTPSELMERPNSWEVAKLLGYTSIIQRDNGEKFIVHPDQAVLGSQPDAGIPIEADIKEVLWYEGKRRVQLSLCPPWTAFGNLEVNLFSTDNLTIGERIKITVAHPVQGDFTNP
jgi:ABC-type Fe3+/spermidine/putrescine transport system ATPase subunit